VHEIGGVKMKKATITLLAVILFLVISACSTPREREFDSFKNDSDNYEKTHTDNEGKVTVSDSVWYNDKLSIAERHHQYDYEQIYRMLKLEAVKKERGLPNQFDAMKTKLNNGDQSILYDAQAYEIDMSARYKCNGFGYKENTPDFNKCVYDYKVTYVNLMMQQQQLMMQAYPIRPLTIPTPTHTDCNQTYGGGFSCTTK
jgi:hypothetical protein